MNYGLQKFPELSSMSRRVTWNYLNGPGSVNFDLIAAKLGAKGRGKCQLSFALLFSSIRPVSAKRTISSFRSNSRRATCNF
jgi:hypothetical protein